MNWRRRIVIWLDIRPGEGRKVTLSVLSAFLVMAFMILARSLREALYLTAFPVETLPYITASVAILSVPTVTFFARTLARGSPERVLLRVTVLLGLGLVALWPVTTRFEAAVVLFYLWTSLGALLLTSGFWVVTADHFFVRRAKRLFGLIGAGGTAGAMAMGNALVWLTHTLDLIWLIPGLLVLLGLFYLTQRALPRLDAPVAAETEAGPRAPLRDSLTLTWRSPHLRATAFIVFSVAVATTLLDYQFKELARAAFTTTEDLTSFFGAFYGWTGALSLLIQLLLVSRIMSGVGVAGALAILPAVLVMGSAGLLLAPALVVVTLVRGADNSLRKSLYRSALEILYVPIPSLLRRRTKTFIDSVVDAFGEGIGAALVFAWVTLPGLPSRYLSAFIIASAIVTLYLSRRMGQHYLHTVTEQLRHSGERAEMPDVRERLEGRGLLSGTYTRLDIESLVATDRPDAFPEAGSRGDAETEGAEPAARDVESRLESGDAHVVAETLARHRAWDATHVPALTRLLARDGLLERTVEILLELGEQAVPHLAYVLADDASDFVIRRRIPRILAQVGGVEAERGLLGALRANRFEVRYRAAIALVRRREADLPRVGRAEEKRVVWEAIRAEVSRERPVWELQRLLDEDPESEDLVVRRVGARGELSLEHTFRLLSLIYDREVVRAAFHGVMLDDEKLKSFSLEYLEQVLPEEVREKLWPFIGDVSEYKREQALRPLDDVVSDLMTTGATLFADDQHREALKRILADRDD